MVKAAVGSVTEMVKLWVRVPPPPSVTVICTVSETPAVRLPARPRSSCVVAPEVVERANFVLPVPPMIENDGSLQDEPTTAAQAAAQAQEMAHPKRNSLSPRELLRRLSDKPAMSTAQRERGETRWGLAAVVVLAVLGLVAASIYIFTPGQARFTAYFDEAGQIKSGDSVRVAGVPVGAVKNVSLDKDRVAVEMSLGDVPVVGAGVAGGPGVSQHQTLMQRGDVDVQADSAYAIDPQFNGGDALERAAPKLPEGMPGTIMMNPPYGERIEVRGKAAAVREGVSVLLRVIYPACPHITHALWAGLGFAKAVGDLLDAPWPKVDEDALKQDEIDVVEDVVLDEDGNDITDEVFAGHEWDGNYTTNDHQYVVGEDAAAAEPVVRLVFEDEWLPAVPMLQVLSNGFLQSLHMVADELGFVNALDSIALGAPLLARLGVEVEIGRAHV